jgi:lysozyme
MSVNQPSVIESILAHEGFVPKPYPDPIHGWGVPTFGHGLTYLTEAESRQIVINRVKTAQAELSRHHPFMAQLPGAAQDVLVEMAFQLGINGTLNFKNMWQALKARNYSQAANEILDSKWAKQTPRRAKVLSDRMRRLADRSWGAL